MSTHPEKDFDVPMSIDKRVKSPSLGIHSPVVTPVVTPKNSIVDSEVSNIKCHFATVVTIFMHQFEAKCHNSMH